MTLDTQLTLSLLQELLMALRANDADGYKSWLALGIEQLGRDVAGEVELDWRVPVLVEEERCRCLHASNNPRTQFIWNDCSLRCGKPKRQQFIETRITAHSIVDNSLPQAISGFVCIATNMFHAIHDPCCSGDVLLTQGQMTLGAE